MEEKTRNEEQDKKERRGSVGGVEVAALRALHLSLEIVGALHDMVSYLLAFAQLVNSTDSFCALNPEPLTPDWGGTERIGSELQEVQKMIDSLQNPLDPSKIAQLLAIHREVMFLQFDAAIRHRLRETFLSSGNVLAYQSVTDRMCHALPPLSNSVTQSAFASQLRLPQLLDPQSCRMLMHFPWRTFLMDGGFFPATINSTINIKYNMQENLAEMMDSSANWLQSRKKTRKVLLRHHDPVTSCNLLRSFLILWKQLEILKAEWGGLKLRTEDINTVPLYKEFCEQYGTDVLYPAMKALARQTGTEDLLGEPAASTQHILPCRGASEIEMKVFQLQKLLESLEIHMIHDVQKKKNQEVTLVTSERARQGSSLPTELWKHEVMQENFSAVRPQIVETFVQKLMENYQESDAEVTFKKSQLQQCLTVLGCDIMARERGNFETYSMFYENILQQEHHLLYRKEQIAGLSHGMIMEMTALRAQLADLEEENLCLKEKIRKEVRDEYESLGRLDDYRLSIDQRVFEIISEVRREGVENIIDLKKKFGSTKNNDDLKEHLSKLCALCLQEALQNQKEQLNAKVMSEQEVALFPGQLAAARKVLAKSQADNSKLKKQLEKQKQMLLEVEHRKTQEARSRQILSAVKAENMEKMLEEMEEKEQRLKCRIKEAEKTSKMSQLQQKTVKKEMQQIRSQLTQERSLKLEAFQRADELQWQVYALEAAVSQRNTNAGKARRSCILLL
nr:LOW QUALITY PROTEIN: coiled-coil domain-containing protein 162-like [Dromaius novaehollandiae]